jgi:hypothetical protein
MTLQRNLMLRQQGVGRAITSALMDAVLAIAMDLIYLMALTKGQ